MLQDTIEIMKIKNSLGQSVAKERRCTRTGNQNSATQKNFSVIPQHHF
jgi:hypothetical protein